MSRPGRKRKMAPRTPCGKIKLRRPTMTELATLDREARQSEMQVVLLQPHRLGDTDQLCVSALGRFVKAHKLRREYHDAAESYAGLVRRLWAAKGVPTDQRSGETGSGIGPSDATVRKWEKEELAVRTALMRVHTQAFLTVRRVAIEDREIRDEMAQFLIAGLKVVAVEYGMARAGDHPFR